MKLRIYGSVYTLSESGKWSGPAGTTLDDLQLLAMDARRELGPSSGDPVTNIFWQAVGRHPGSEVVEAPEERDDDDVPGLVY